MMKYALFLLSFGVFAQTFPLHFSSNKRFLETAEGKPFLIKEFSAWGFLQAIPEKTELAMMDSLKKKGFNTLMVSIVSNASSQMAGKPPYWQGVAPFLVPWDFSKPNEAYFKHVDRILKAAEKKGFFVMLVPCYLGYYTDPGQGWWDEMRAPNNSPEKMKMYGEFLGKRYANSPNIMWIAGGDNNAAGPDQPYMQNLIEGIKRHDKDHLWTGHFDSGSGNIWSTDNPLYSRYIDIDGQYVWKEISMGSRGPQYVSEISQYAKGRMTVQLDQSYEHDVPHYADNENPQWIRRKMYDGLLSGCAGTSFSSGTVDNQAYWFKNVLAVMNTPSMQDASRCFRLFEALPWQSLQPDTSQAVLTTGRGKWGSIDYICTAKSTDNKLFMAYIPVGHTFYVNLAALSALPKTLWWYNPRSGQVMKIGGVNQEVDFGVVCPDANDWVLILESLGGLKW